MSNSKKSKLDQKIDKLKSNEVNPPADMWDRIEEKLQEESGVRKLSNPDKDVKAS
ncbi:MAG: hypothetical protein HKN22_01745 [Bacteroidia bacterium]|nr:hypothetical protein [Bacteroidia bacterium]